MHYYVGLLVVSIVLILLLIVIYCLTHRDVKSSSKCTNAVLYGRCKLGDMTCDNPTLACNARDGYWKQKEAQACSTKQDCMDGLSCLNWKCQKPHDWLQPHNPVLERVVRPSNKRVKFR